LLEEVTQLFNCAVSIPLSTPISSIALGTSLTLLCHSPLIICLPRSTKDSSWLNQVEIWFSKIERDVIAHGVFTSVADLARKLMNYIRRYNRDPKPIKWTYRDPSHRIQGFDSSVTVH
jgi:hypothetical protein